jgi:fructose-bisphosphate aldolase class I
VPAAVAGIVFLSGGQSGDLATARLNAMNAAGRPPLPWPVAFSYGRAIQQPALSIWDGRHTNAGRAQHAIAQRAKANRDARRGECAHTAILAPA